ncbi:MAG: aminoacyl-histidine dipeptidase [Candidatus Delongbacteria bacterium]|jgi:dipeptidase D|nr:aminoacyl-histidine dipeptidase [Candidatus Delongbacteria bacterium]
MITDLNPKLLWKHFYNISQIPHPSKKEEKLIKYLVDFAIEQGLDYKLDEVGNVLIKKAATKGKENSQTTVLQSHIDMVCEKNEGIDHNFDNDPLKLIIDNGWVTAEGTTLGADDGIGVAASLAVLEENTIEHGNLECLFTVDEETGLNGANGLRKDFVDGKLLLNLDSEEEGAVYIGCAGGKSTLLHKQIKTISQTEGEVIYNIKLSGLQGGHSGLVINKGLGNAVILLARFLWNINDKLNFSLFSFEGGDKHNAIPREANAVIGVKQQDEPLLDAEIKKYIKIYRDEYKKIDDKVVISKKKVKQEGNVFSEKDKGVLLNLLYSFPAGVFSMSKDIHGLVETSTNLASVTFVEDAIKILTSQRSSVASSIKDISDKIISIGMLAGYDYETEDPYPSWTPNPDSKILKIVQSVYKETFNDEISVKAVHAGLECGIIGDKYPDMDMVSFGPTVEGAHSPDERLEISSVENFWLLLKGILKKI